MKIKLKQSNNSIESAQKSIQEGNFQEGITHFKEAISIKEEQPAWVYHTLADLLVKQDCISEAILYYKKALDSNPTHSHTIYFKLGNSFQKVRKFEDAVNAYRKSIDLKHTWHQSYGKISEIMAKQARIEEAIEYQKAALKIDSENKKYKYSLINLCQRNENQSILNQYNYQIISLGLNCLSRTLPTKWGLKKLKYQGELSTPFDLAVHPYPSICSLIENDFLDYLNPSFLSTVKNSEKSTSCIINSKYNCVFNHEKEMFWSDKNFENFIKRYKSRVENFYEVTKNDNLLFLLHVFGQREINPNRILSILEKKFKNKFFKLVFIDTRFQGDLKSSFKYFKNSNLIKITHPLPYSDYVWHQANHYQSELGLKFEKQILIFLSKIITECFPKK